MNDVSANMFAGGLVLSDNMLPQEQMLKYHKLNHAEYRPAILLHSDTG